jgi:hypothetical protein
MLTKELPATAPAYRVSVTWGEVEQLDAVIDRSADLGPTGAHNSVGVKFDGLLAELKSGGRTSRAVTVSSVVAPVARPAEPPRDVDGSHMLMEFLGYKLSVRGYVEKPTDARAVVTVNAAGATKVIEFPFDVEHSLADGAQLTANFDVPFFAAHHLVPAGDPPAYPTLPPFGVDILIAVERRHSDAAVLARVEEVDVTAVFASPNGPAPSACG